MLIYFIKNNSPQTLISLMPTIYHAFKVAGRCFANGTKINMDQHENG